MLDGRPSTKRVMRKSSQHEMLHSRSFLDGSRTERRDQERMKTLDNLLTSRARCRNELFDRQNQVEGFLKR